MAAGSRAKRRLVLGLDLGGTKILSGLISRRGDLVRVRRVPLTGRTREAVLVQLAEIVRQARGELPTDAAVEGIGVAVPGAVRADGTVWAPNLPGWDRVPLAAYLSQITGLRVVVQDDRLTSLLGECWLGAAKRVRNAAFITIGTGIGAGIMADGHLWTGAHGVAGSLGWWVVRGTSAGAAARRIGSLEATAAGPAMFRRMKQSGIVGQSAQDLVVAARRGNRRAQHLLEDIAHVIGLAVANLVSLLDPEIVILGGGVASAGRLLLDPIRVTVRRYAQPLTRSVRIRRSTLGTRASLFGSAAIVYRDAVSTPTT